MGVEFDQPLGAGLVLHPLVLNNTHARLAHRQFGKVLRLGVASVRCCRDNAADAGAVQFPQARGGPAGAVQHEFGAFELRIGHFHERFGHDQAAFLARCSNSRARGMAASKRSMMSSQVS